MAKDWVIAPPWKDREGLAAALRISPVVAQVLHNRGIDDAETARQFLSPQLADLYAPEALPGATAAAERIHAALRAGEKIVLFGDYDVDGITGVSILWHGLRLAGAAPGFYVPHRVEEGYGISAEAIDKLADEGARLIITVDCGVTAIEPAAQARRRGVDLIITDHHAPHTDDAGRPQLPDAILVHPGIAPSGAATFTSHTDARHECRGSGSVAVLTARREQSRGSDAPVQPGHNWPGSDRPGSDRPGSVGQPYPNPDLSGAGVAFKLAWALAQRVSNSTKVKPEFRDFLVDATGLAALGIVADVVPLAGENRIIAHQGLRGLPHSRLPGIQALIQAAGLNGKRLYGYDVGFRLAPRLNAIGRMGHALLAVEMMTRASPTEAVRIAANLEHHNRARQRVEGEIFQEARRMVVEQGQDSDAVRAIVLASPKWHVGVIGIVASRIVEVFGRPTVLIALDGEAGQGSGRGIRHFPLHEVLADCREHLVAYGGHAMAAGLRIEAGRVAAFREAFQQRAAQLLTPADLRPKLHVDDVVGLGQLSEQLVADLGRLEPFGAGNPSPKLATDWLDVIGDPRAVGASGTHLQVTLGSGGTRCKAIAFGKANLLPRLQDHRRCRVVFQPIINEWQGRRSVELQILDFQFPQE